MWGSRSSLYVFGASTVNLQRCMDEILEAYMRFFWVLWARTTFFMDENKLPHGTHLVDEFHLGGNIRHMDWPSRSSDLNPIEHI
ncbi:hypothetical protein TNCV_2393311 [Trichonephila clavipes]|nr:hypothetical protein TNCV_2393311 [Trichonephila clavipes]